MNASVEKFNLWIKRHKLFAVSAPIVVILTVYFISASVTSMRAKETDFSQEGDYNNSLPGQKKELTVKKPNDLYKKSQQDSLAALREKGIFKSILETKKENDSLERLLEELNNFSLERPEANNLDFGKIDMNTVVEPPEYVSKKTAAQEKLDYRNLLMQARNERLSQSQDYSAPYSEISTTSAATSISFDAAIYRDQFILPGNRVTLILKEDVEYNGKRFPKNTFVYATANVQGSRVLLEVTNIDNVRLPLMAIDREDGMTGLHNERAGELMQEFKADVQTQSANELSEAVGETVDMPLAKNLLRSFGNYFQKKKYKQRDKILLVNGDRVFLVAKK